MAKAIPLATAPMKHISLFFIIILPSLSFPANSSRDKTYFQRHKCIASGLFCHCNHCKLSSHLIAVFLWNYCPIFLSPSLNIIWLITYLPHRCLHFHGYFLLPLIFSKSYHFRLVLVYLILDSPTIFRIHNQNIHCIAIWNFL